MKLTAQTKEILKNFASISSSVFFYGGKKQKATLPSKALIVEAQMDEFPQDFGIHDLSKFIGVLNLFNDPELTFNNNDIALTEGEMKAVYRTSPKSVIKNVPDINKHITLSNIEASFTLTADNLKNTLKYASAVGAPHFEVVGDGKHVSIVVRDVDNDSSDQISKVVGDTTQTFSFIGDIDNIRFLEKDYDVSATKTPNGVMEFAAKDGTVKYFLAVRV